MLCISSHNKTPAHTSLSFVFYLQLWFSQVLYQAERQISIYSHRYSFSLRVQGPKIWTNLPLSLRNSLTTSNYRQKRRDYFHLIWIYCHLTHTGLFIYCYFLLFHNSYYCISPYCFMFHFVMNRIINNTMYALNNLALAI